jgi:hypothetical protein
MIVREMGVIPGPPSKIVFSPATISFDAFEIDVPILTTDGPSLANFTERIDAEICNSCSRESCLGWAALRTQALNETDKVSILFVDGAAVFCKNDDCPLEGPPDDGVRAPRPQVPTFPTSRIETPLPAI